MPGVSVSLRLFMWQQYGLQDCINPAHTPSIALSGTQKLNYAEVLGEFTAVTRHWVPAAVKSSKI